MYKVIVYKESNRQLSFIENENIEGPFLEINIPCEKASFDDREHFAEFAGGLGAKITTFIDCAENSSNVSKPKKLFSYSSLCDEDYKYGFFNRGFDIIEEDVRNFKKEFPEES